MQRLAKTLFVASLVLCSLVVEGAMAAKIVRLVDEPLYGGQ